jgi:hypothetical protein
MHRPPTQGVEGSKPRIAAGAGGNGKVTKEELSQLNRAYLEARNRSQLAKAAAAEMSLAERQGTLISKRLAKLEVSFILNSFRQRVMAEPVQLALRLVRAGFCAEVDQHSAQEIIRSALHGMLRELSEIPDKLAGADLSAPVDGERGAGFVEHPSLVRNRAQKAKVRRAQRTASQRKLREQG